MAHVRPFLAAPAALLLAAGCGGAMASGAPTTVTSPHVSHGRTISPAGAPYRYTLPAGFAVFRREIEPADAGAYRDLSMIGVGRSNVISVKVFPNSQPVVAATEADAVMSDASRMQSDLAATGARAGGFARVTVGGDPAVRFTVHDLPNPTGGSRPSAVRTLIFRAGYTVLVSCQWSTAAAAPVIAAGCASVQRTLTLR